MIDEKLYKKGFLSGRRSGFDYFDAYRRQAAFAEEMLLNLRSGVKAGELGARELVRALHTIENDADAIEAAVRERLLSDFIVPLDRRGMDALAQALDDVADSTERLAELSFVFGATSLPEGGMPMMDLVVEACSALRLMIDGLADGREGMREALSQVQGAEARCDALHLDAARALYADESRGAEDARMAHALLDALEDAMDSVEAAALRADALAASAF